jgi:hypothetical protein
LGLSPLRIARLGARRRERETRRVGGLSDNPTREPSPARSGRLLDDEVTTFDHALTPLWMAAKHRRRSPTREPILRGPTMKIR